MCQTLSRTIRGHSNVSSVAHGIFSFQGIQDSWVKFIKMIQVMDCALKMSVQLTGYGTIQLQICNSSSAPL